MLLWILDLFPDALIKRYAYVVAEKMETSQIFHFITFNQKQIPDFESVLINTFYKRNQVISTYISGEKCERTSIVTRIMKTHIFMENLFLDESFICSDILVCFPQISILKQMYFFRKCWQIP